MTFKQKITMALAYRGMTKTAVARAIGMSRQCFYYKLNNARFTLNEMERIAEALGARYEVEFEMEDGTRV